MSDADFEALLQQHLGLDAASVGAELIERAVQERQLACQLAAREAYFEHVQRSPTELQELVEAVVVPETWFFREREAYAALVNALGERSFAEPSRRLSLLSLPCATGEEPFSMAMALLDAGIPEQRFAIDAVDISERALRRGRNGVYAKNSFRGVDLGFRDRHFELVSSGYRLSERVRRKVSFQQGNLLSADAMLGKRYDAVFCRNVLIYLDPAARQRAQRVLSALLVEDGLLFVGPAEASTLSAELFVSTRMPLASAFRKAFPERVVQPAAVADANRRSPGKIAKVSPLPRALDHAVPALAALPTPKRAPLSDARAHLSRAAALADRGRLADASELCSEHLRSYGPSAALFHLMALLSEAANDAVDAIALHKKALYLDPNHEQSLVHLALLLDQQGDREAAERLRRRARRLSPGEGS